MQINLIHIILLSCMCSTLAITVHFHPTENSNTNVRKYNTALKDIRLVSTNPPDTLQIQDDNKDEVKPFQKPRGELKFTRQNPLPKPGIEKKKFSVPVERIGRNQNLQKDPNHQIYMQKMANQLYMAQKHASLLSDYQKFIVNQDPDVKNFVLAQTIQERNPKPFRRQKQSGRALSPTATSKYVSPAPVTASTADYKKIVVVTPKVQTTVDKNLSQNDHLAQATHLKYITLEPQPLMHFVENQEVKVTPTLVPYYTSQPHTYYDLGVTHKPQVEIPTTVSLELGSYISPQYYKEENEHEDDHKQANYEFMYNVKDHEKNNHFGHKESRTDKTTYGYYFVHLPDGRLETVKYWADKTGYHAKVDYQGEAKHPLSTQLKLHSHNLLHH